MSQKKYQTIRERRVNAERDWDGDDAVPWQITDGTAVVRVLPPAYQQDGPCIVARLIEVMGIVSDERPSAGQAARLLGQEHLQSLSDIMAANDNGDPIEAEELLELLIPCLSIPVVSAPEYTPSPNLPQTLGPLLAELWPVQRPTESVPRRRAAFHCSA